MAERAIPEREQYPNNSDRAKEKAKADAKKPVKEVTRVTKGKVHQRKKPLGRRFAEAFGAQEGQGVIEYILYDIIIPATKNMLLDSISDGVEMALFGEVRARRRRPGGGGGQRSRYDYDRVSYRNDDRDRRDMRDRRDRNRANLRDYEDIIFDSKADAEEVISGLVDLIDGYGQATVIDLYDLSGVTPPSDMYNMDNYGWTNLGSATSVRNRDGYVLNLPRAVLL